MLSAGQARKQRHELDRERARHLREQAAATVRSLRAQLHAARVERNDKLAEVRKEARAHRLALREHHHARRVKTLAELRDTYARERAEARETYLVRIAEVVNASRDPIERSRQKWEAERKYQEDLRRIERANRERHRVAQRVHVEARRSESDDEVRSNIPMDYVPLFERVKRSIKGSTRESRTEAFMKYAEQHAEEIVTALEAESERKFHELQEKHAKAERELRRASRAPTKRTYSAAELAEVPF